MRTLVVDDQAVNRLVLHHLLARFGPCEMMAEGTAGIAAWLKALEDGKPFDLICLDIRMPGMNGHQAWPRSAGWRPRAGPAAAST